MTVQELLLEYTLVIVVLGCFSLLFLSTKLFGAVKVASSWEIAVVCNGEGVLDCSRLDTAQAQQTFYPAVDHGDSTILVTSE